MFCSLDRAAERFFLCFELTLALTTPNPYLNLNIPNPTPNVNFFNLYVYLHRHKWHKGHKRLYKNTLLPGIPLVHVSLGVCWFASLVAIRFVSLFSACLVATGKQSVKISEEQLHLEFTQKGKTAQ